MKPYFYSFFLPQLHKLYYFSIIYHRIIIATNLYFQF